MSERRVVITGLGVVSPLGCDLEVFWRSLLAGQSGIGPITRFDTTGLDCKIGGEVKDFHPERFMPPKEVRRNDRFVLPRRLFTHCAISNECNFKSIKPVLPSWGSKRSRAI